MLETKYKVAIGAVGALCLSLLKLISANFYLAEVDYSTRVGAYLTFVAYLLLGMAVAAFLTDDHPNDLSKSKKSAFLMGLLAPSILLAIISKPIKSTPDVAIPDLSFSIPFFNSSAYAQETTAIPAPANGLTEASPKITIKMLNKGNVSAGIGQGFAKALGVGAEQPKFIYVVGKTGDQKVAMENAEKINTFLRKSAENTKTVNLYKLEDRSEYIVAVGEPVAVNEVPQLRVDLKFAVGESLKTNPTATDGSTAAKVLEGRVVDGAALFKK
jgi:hypothetical protein